jgi:hypothetical protein
MDVTVDYGGTIPCLVNFDVNANDPTSDDGNVFPLMNESWQDETPGPGQVTSNLGTADWQTRPGDYGGNIYFNTTLGMSLIGGEIKADLSHNCIIAPTIELYSTDPGLPNIDLWYTNNAPKGTAWETETLPGDTIVAPTTRTLTPDAGGTCLVELLFAIMANSQEGSFSALVTFLLTGN